MEKVSKSAMEAAQDIERYFGLQNCTKPIRAMVAKRIDLALADLLEKAQAVNEAAKEIKLHHEGNLPVIRGIAKLRDSSRAFDAALEPWKISVENRKPGE